MKRKRSEKREKLDNWEKKNVNELYEKMKQLIEAPAPPPQQIRVKDEEEEAQKVDGMQTERTARNRRTKVRVVMDLESNIGKEKRQRRERLAKKKAAKKNKGQSAEKMDVIEIEKQSAQQQEA